jgi:OOP family OmpA-OmpF porin
MRSPGGPGSAANSFGVLILTSMLAAALVPAQASAQPQSAGAESVTGAALPSAGWYGGISAGRSQAGIRESVTPVTGTAVSRLYADDSSSGFGFYGGYQFNRNFTLEGGYADSGRFDMRREIASPASAATGSGIRASGFYVGALGVLPLPNRFSLYGKLGTGYTTSAATSAAFASASGAMQPMSAPADQVWRRTEWNSKIGLGASYEMSNRLGLRFEYERTNSMGYGGAGEGNVGMWSLGLIRRY